MFHFHDHRKEVTGLLINFLCIFIVRVWESNKFLSSTIMSIFRFYSPRNLFIFLSFLNYLRIPRVSLSDPCFKFPNSATSWIDS
jgi:hypothetical protein